MSTPEEFITPEKLRSRKKLLEKAFMAKSFQADLTKMRLAIEKKLKEFLKIMHSELNDNQLFFNNVESRVKSPSSFMEKIERKDYLLTWDITNDITHNQQQIATKLSDLIGFRITCFFMQDEKDIYDLLRKVAVYEDFKDLHLNFDENTTQANGHTIYKVTGTYEAPNHQWVKTCCFELQIKAIMHNIWGEVEHKTIYKEQDYDPYTDDKKKITEQIFNILQASDQQLVTLFSRKNDLDKLTCAMFYEQTKEDVQKQAHTKILGFHYKVFFHLFNKQNENEQIKQYVGSTLLGVPYARISTKSVAAPPKTDILADMIRKQFFHYNLNCLFLICKLLYELDDYNEFIPFLARYLLNIYDSPVSTEVDAFDSISFGYSPEFGDEEEDDDVPTTTETDINMLEDILYHLHEKTGAWKKEYRKQYDEKKAKAAGKNTSSKNGGKG